MRIAEAGIQELQQFVDTLIIIPNQNLFRVANETHDLRRRLQHGRRGAAFRRARRHRPDGHAGPDQSRLRRHPRGDDRDGQGDDGHRRGRGRRPRHRRRRGGDLQPAARRCLDEGRARRAHQHHRRPRHDAVRGRRGGQPHPRARSIPTPTSSSARPSTRASRARCASRWSPPASTAWPCSSRARSRSAW